MLVGGGRVFVVVESARSVVRTSHLAKLLRWAGRPAVRRVVLWHPSMHILESDGLSVRSTMLADESAFDEVMPFGPHLYVIGALGEDAISQWRDGKVVSVPADEGAKILRGLADDLPSQCAAQGWEFTLLAGDDASRLTKTVSLGNREVKLELELARANTNSPRLLHARIELPGTKPHIETFPAAGEAGL